MMRAEVVLGGGSRQQQRSLKVRLTFVYGRVVVASTLGRKPPRRQAHYKNGEMTRPATKSPVSTAKSARFEQARLC